MDLLDEMLYSDGITVVPKECRTIELGCLVHSSAHLGIKRIYDKHLQIKNMERLEQVVHLNRYWPPPPPPPPVPLHNTHGNTLWDSLHQDWN